MKMKKILGVALVAALSMTAVNSATASECGMSCCIAAGVEGIGSSLGFSVTAQYDSMNMETIKQGTTELTTQQALDTGVSPMYAIPTKMVMTKISANIAYRHDEDNAFILSIPYVINDMDMQRRNGMKMTMDTVSGIGDTSFIYLRDIYKDADIRTRKRFSVGIGIKAPTGKEDSRNSKGNLVHMMMQAGTGSWDGFLLANGTLSFGEHEDGGALWFLSPSAMYQITTKNDLGYKVGNRLNYDLSARYRVSSSFNVKLDLNGIYSSKDSTDGTKDSPGDPFPAYQNPMMSMIDNVENTGLHSIFISPGIQWLISPEFSVSGEYRIPVYQNVNGTQQVTDNWFFLRATARF
jgi:hypothetical protein